MKTILILTKQPTLASAMQSALDPSRYKAIAKDELWEAESLLLRGAVDAVILDVELTDVRAVRGIEEVKRHAPRAPLIVYTADKQWEWEEDAYMLGVDHIMTKPVRGKLLNTLLDRAFGEHHPMSHGTSGFGGNNDSYYEHEQRSSRALAPASATVVSTRPHHAQHSGHATHSISGIAPDHFRALEALRHFSGVLTHSLNPEALLKQFLLLLREIIGVNRAVIFLRKPASLLSESAHSQEDRWLRSACAIGLEQSFLEHFALSLSAGIGASLRRQGRILKVTSSEAQSNREILKEFQLLGAHVAIPILDRETLIGVAVFDERLTGESYANEELSLIFHMLEEVGLAIRNSWLHDQLIANHAMVADILGTLGSGCVVASPNLAILHTNSSARRIFLEYKGGKRQLEFADLPQEIGSKVFTVMKNGAEIAPFKYTFPERPQVVYQATISPFKMQGSAVPNAALLIMDDITQKEHARRLEVEAAGLRLITAMAEHLAHEIGNSVVPISTHQQLLAEVKLDDPEFRESLSTALSEGVKRITRLSNQMMFLARGKTDFGDQVRVCDLLSEAFRDAYIYHTGKLPEQNIAADIDPVMVAGDHKALRHAFAEVMLNALQANPKDPKIAVRVTRKNGNGNGVGAVSVEVRDSGGGFTKQAAEKAIDPFFSTRSVGLGIGLTVTRKIIEDHRGKLEIESSERGPGIVNILLPLTSQN